MTDDRIDRMTDAQWRCLHSFLSTCPDVRVGKETRCRLFVEAARWMARRGAPWRQLPPEYGKWNSVYRRYAHWCDRGVWRRLMTYLQTDPDLSAVQLDSTHVCAHVSAAGAPKSPGTDHALGRSRGGFGTKIHILADRRGRPLRLRVTGGQRHHSTQARALVEAWTGAPLPCLIADRAYDGDDFRTWLAQRGTEAVIPARKGRTNPQPHDPELYKARNAIERGIGQLKQGRRVATRYDKYAQRFLGFLYLARAWIWLKSCLNTA